jgi:hypothetical protein
MSMIQRLCAACIVLLGVGWVWGQGVSDKIMMRVSFDEPLFDASAWFANGTYQRVLNDNPQLFPGLKYSRLSMRRTSPPPFTDEEVLSLRTRIYMALTDDFDARHGLYPCPIVPESVETIGAGSDFDPRPQVIYAYSGFARGFDSPGRMQEPIHSHVDYYPKPVDYYHFYTLLDGERFYVSIKRDGVSGEIIHTSRLVSLGIPKDEEERRFQKLQPGLQPKPDGNWMHVAGKCVRNNLPAPG